MSKEELIKSNFSSAVKISEFNNNYKKYWDPIINMYDQAEKNNFGIKSLHNLCDLINTLQEFKKIFP